MSILDGCCFGSAGSCRYDGRRSGFGRGNDLYLKEVYVDSGG